MLKRAAARARASPSPRRSRRSTSCCRRWRSSTAGSADWKIGILDTIADNASSGGVVLGSTPDRRSTTSTCGWPGCVLHRNGEVVGTGAGGAVLGSPLNSLVWLANTVGARGVALEAGHVVLPGVDHAPCVPVAAGRHLHRHVRRPRQRHRTLREGGDPS